MDNFQYPKELLALERHAFAVTKAMPALKKAHREYSGQELFDRIESIECEFGLTLA